MNTIKRAAAVLIFSLLAIMGGSSAASACAAAPTTVAVPGGYVFAAEDGSGAMIGTDNECYAYVIMDDATGVLVFRDYGTDAAGTVLPLTTCEGEEISHTFTIDGVDQDGAANYVLDDETV